MTQSQLLDPLSPLPPPARLGEVLGKYRLDRIVATGGMGVVVEATHLRLDKRVAIKFLSPLLASDETGVRRFLQEARAAARLGSEHVARIFDVETLPTGTPYIVMEFLEGEDLSVMLEHRGWLPPHEAVGYVLQACEAMAEAHLLGIVHRDLKPANLFHCTRADRRPFVKVLDFGVSKLLPWARIAQHSRASTGPVAVLGTPLYASPEQLRSSTEVDVRTDIWALGVILYELIAGKPPFRGDTLFELRAKISKAPLQPLHELRPEVPEQLGAVVAKCLAKDRDERYATVADLAEALAPYAPRSSLLSVQRVENILRTQRDLDRTLPSETGRRAARVPPSGVSPKRAATRWRPSRAVMLGSMAAAFVGAGLIAAWIAAARPLEGQRVLRSEDALSAPVPVRSEQELETQELVPLPSATPTTTDTSAASIQPPPRPRRPAPGTEGFGGLR